MYQHQHDPWGPLPNRSAGQLWALCLLSLPFLPVWWALILAVFLGFLAVGLVVEVLSVVIPPLEKGFERVMDRFVEAVPLVPAWCVSPGQVAHEGDAAYYQARVDKHVGRFLRDRSAHEIPVRIYRGIGAGYAVHAARARGWDLSHDRASDPLTVVRLRKLPVPA
ncbi:hypothetical protein ACQUSR_26275 [Streptomyces sp. P1-3]|uniref:hypothetical protein n=1 Tax=Streptomyces sp. P1-3 TaxID=3421658 RepID=UPI003D3655E9